MHDRLFPYQPRPGQEGLMSAVSDACRDRAHLVVESGTGTGKTVCALSACAAQCRERGKKLLYLTRTNSQQRQVMLELRRMNEKGRVFGVALQGRKNMCPLAMKDEELMQGSSEELSKVCSERKARVLRGEEEACEFYSNTVSEDLQPVMAFARDELPTAEEFVRHCIDRKLCPYEIAKQHVAMAEVVAVPYIMFFDGFIRHALLDWMACALPDVVLIVDEAHNLPSYARELESAKLSSIGLRLAEREVEEFGDPEVAEGVSLRDFVLMLQETLDKGVEEYLIDEDGIIPDGFVGEELMFRTRQTSRGVSNMVSHAVNFGEMVRDRKKLSGRLPRSYVHNTANFMTFWHTLEEGEYIKLVVADGDTKALEAYCLDASIACKPVAECHASVHMSGTLTPLDQYIDTIGLPKDSRRAEVPSPFPPENRLVLYVDDVTTKYEEVERDRAMVDKLADRVSGLVEGVGRNTIVFYPSYALMERVATKVSGMSDGRAVHFESRGMDQAELMEAVSRFKSGKGALLHAVSGGRISEGIDFPGEEMEVAIIAGIPYPKPTAKQRALQHFCEIRFGRGWEHAVQAPTTRKVQQAIGRLIRSDTDRGVAVILDKRAVHFKEVLGARRSDDPVAEAVVFFAAPPEPVRPRPPAPRKGLQL